MQEPQRAKQPEPERTRDVLAPKPMQRKEQVQRSSEPQRRSLYEQIVGNRVPPHLRLSALPQTSDEQPAPRSVEEDVPQGEPLAPVSGEEQSPAQRKEALRAQLWGTGVPPHLRLSSHSEPVQRKENTTGLPDMLKEGVEGLSGLSLDDVHVNYNSTKPAEVQALAYTQGTEIYVGPDQEQHLAHEAWHVVQQKQGRVKPTAQVGEMEINTDLILEQEADVLGKKSTISQSEHTRRSGSDRLPSMLASVPIQRMKGYRNSLQDKQEEVGSSGPDSEQKMVDEIDGLKTQLQVTRDLIATHQKEPDSEDRDDRIAELQELVTNLNDQISNKQSQLLIARSRRKAFEQGSIYQ